MSTNESAWVSQSYEILIDEAVRVEFEHSRRHETSTSDIRSKLDGLILTCSFAQRSTYEEFAAFWRERLTLNDMNPPTIEPFLRAAWRASEDDASGFRPIPGGADVKARGRELQRSMILDTEESWAYEGYCIEFRDELEEGEDPLTLAVSYGEPLTIDIQRMEEGMREYIDSGAAEAYSADVASKFKRKQGA